MGESILGILESLFGKVTRGLKVALYRKDISVHILSFPGSFG